MRYFNPNPLAASISNQHAKDFAVLAQNILRHKSKAGLIHEIESHGSKAVGGIRIADMVRKSAVPAMGTGNTSQLVDLAVSTGFLQTLQFSAFEQIAAAAVPATVGHGRLGGVNQNATAYAMNEGEMKPISSIGSGLTLYDPSKAMTAIVFTQELVRSMLPGATAYIEDCLRKAVTYVTDVKFFSNILSGVSGATSTGQNKASVAADMNYLQSQLGKGEGSQYFIVVTPDIAGAWWTMSDGAGFRVTPNGGSWNDVPVLVSSGLSAGQVVMIDAAGIAAAKGTIELEDFEHGMVAPSDAPDSPPSASTTMESLWQANKTALRAERWFVGAKVRSNAVALITNSSSYAGANSPA